MTIKRRDFQDLKNHRNFKCHVSVYIKKTKVYNKNLLILTNQTFKIKNDEENTRVFNTLNNNIRIDIFNKIELFLKKWSDYIKENYNYRTKKGPFYKTMGIEKLFSSEKKQLKQFQTTMKKMTTTSSFKSQTGQFIEPTITTNGKWETLRWHT